MHFRKGHKVAKSGIHARQNVLSLFYIQGKSVTLIVETWSRGWGISLNSTLLVLIPGKHIICIISFNVLLENGRSTESCNNFYIYLLFKVARLRSAILLSSETTW